MCENKFKKKGGDKLKKIILFIGAFSTLVGINTLMKFLQSYLIYEQNDSLLKTFILMFITSTIVRYFLILIYDYIKADLFSIELFKEAKEGEAGINNKLLKKIIRLRVYGKFFLYIGLAFTDPIFVAIYYRKGHHEWNNIPDFKILGLFLLSSLLCSFSLFLFLSGVHIGFNL